MNDYKVLGWGVKAGNNIKNFHPELTLAIMLKYFKLYDMGK